MSETTKGMGMNRIEHFEAQVTIGMGDDFAMRECDKEIVYWDYRDAPNDWQSHERHLRDPGVYRVTGHVEYTEETARNDQHCNTIYDLDYTTKWERIL